MCLYNIVWTVRWYIYFIRKHRKNCIKLLESIRQLLLVPTKSNNSDTFQNILAQVLTWASMRNSFFQRFRENYNIYENVTYITIVLVFNKVTIQSTHWSIQTLFISGGDSSCSWVFYSCTGPKCGVGVNLVDCNAVGGWPHSHQYWPEC